MQELFLALIQEPGRDTYLAARFALVDSNFYNPYSDDFTESSKLLEAGDYEGAQKRLAEGMPNLLLAPRAHLMLAFAAEKLGDDDGTQMESYIAGAIVRGITATGDGSADKPWQATRTSDEHDVLQFLEKEFSEQELIEINDRKIDVLTCTDGSQFHFDVTDVQDRLKEVLGE